MTDAEFEIEYVHRRKKFRVIISRLAWWDFPNEKKEVMVHKLGYPSRKWTTTIASFKKLYRPT